MSTILAVTFDQPNALDSAELKEPLQAAVPDLQQIPGLLWKIWTSDVEHGRGASFYLFDTKEHATAWGGGPMVDSLNSLPGYSNIKVEYFDVAEDFSKQTFATLERAKA